MKKLFLIVLSVMFFSFFGSINKNSFINTTSATANIEFSSDVDYVEYVLIGDQWYKITHYIDGSVGVEPVNRPPQD
jgi:hypothetical protein